MSTLVDEAFSGTLTPGSLEDYIAAADRSIIDQPGGSRNLTPLCAAVLGGHLDIVDILLYNQADPNAASPRNGRTPLLVATSARLPANQAAIVSTLLRAGAEVDRSDTTLGNNTPLMNAIVQLRDVAVIHELVDNGADVTRTNARGQSAEYLAKRYGMERALRSRAERQSAMGYFIDLLVAAVLFILAIIDSGTIEDTVKGAINKLYHITCTKNVTPTQVQVFKDMGKKIDTQDPSGSKSGKNAVEKILSPVSPIKTPQINLNPQQITVMNLDKAVDSFLDDNNLKTFFKPGDTFVRSLITKAAALPKDAVYSKQDNLKRLACLSLYQPVIYCDDSGSMDGDQRYEYQREIVKRIARIATKILPDDCGVELRFINDNSQHRPLSTPQEIDAVMHRINPTGPGTKLGTGLRDKILAPLVYKLIDTGQPLRRPILVCTITDGFPNNEDENTFRNAIVKCKKKLLAKGYDTSSVMFLVSQVGNEASASNFLRILKADNQIEDILHCTSDRLDEKFKEFKGAEDRLEEWLLKILTSPIMF